MPEPDVTRTILIVDDEAALSQLMGRFLEDRGWVTLVAESGAAALRIVETYPDDIDLLVTDVVMEKMDGFTLAALVADERPAVRILYVTGHRDDTRGVGRGLREAGRFFLTKPFGRQAFLETVDAALDRAVRATDEVALILGNPLVEARPLDTADPDGATRYAAQLPVRYRWPGMEVWRAAHTRTISRSRVELDARGADEPPTAVDGAPTIELRIELPSPGARRAEVAALGRIAATTRSRLEPEGLAVVVDVARYRADIRR